MNLISESGRRYDVTRHVKRTLKYFAPKEVFFESAAEKEENTILENQGENTDILLEGHRQPEILNQYLSTSSSIPGNIECYLFSYIKFVCVDSGGGGRKSVRSKIASSSILPVRTKVPTTDTVSNSGGRSIEDHHCRLKNLPRQSYRR